MILVVGGIKGGCGKTTLATNLAVINWKAGHKTLLVDADDQKSASDWSEERINYYSKDIEEVIPTVVLTGKSIYAQIEHLREDYERIIIDTGGRDTVSQRAALTIADQYLVPFQPRSLAIWTAPKVNELFEEVKAINRKIEIIVCINQADSSGSDNEDTKEILSENKNFKLAPSVGHRKAFSNAMSFGLGVIELPKSDQKAMVEIFDLHSFIYGDDERNDKLEKVYGKHIKKKQHIEV